MEDIKFMPGLKKVADIGKRKFCSDFDSDCFDIDEVKCFLGGTSTCQNGFIGWTPLADGICVVMELKRNGEPSTNK